jgi:hypothetical protein
MAFVPDIKAGVVMMGNSSGMDYGTIAESVFAVLLGKDPDQVVPALLIRERMQRLTGSYETYRGVERLEVVSRGGMLYLEQSSPFTDESRLTPLVPEDPTLSSTDFRIVAYGVSSPAVFSTDDNGRVHLCIGRYCYHKVD